jgi:tetratricopeptide (TPR) repeat protein
MADKAKEQTISHKDNKNEIKKGKTLIFIALIVIAGFIAYGNAFRGKFILDDYILVKDNSYIKSCSKLLNLFTKDIGAGSQNRYNSYRPFQMLTYMIDYYLWKLNVTGYHLSNILLHILSALSIFWLVTILFKDQLLSLITSILFVVHPIHTEAISYISGRSDPLATVFMLLTLIFYIKQLREMSAKIYVFTVLSYLLALLSRENAIIVPALLLIYHLTFRKKIQSREFLSLLTIAITYIILRMTVLKFTSSEQALLSPPTTLLQRMPGFFVAITNYLRLLLLPFNLHMEYGGPLFKFIDLKAISGIIILFSSIIFAIAAKEKHKLVFFSIFWFFTALLPVSHLYPINAYMAEHWLYLPSIGFFLVCAKGLSSLYGRKEYRIPSLIIIVSLVTFYSYLTIKQNDYWKEPAAFYERTIKYVPGSPRILHNLANLYDESGKKEKAITLYKKAIEINPNIAQAHHNLGLTYNEVGNKQEAINSFKKAVALDPNFSQAYNDLGLVYSEIGEKEQAIKYYKKAIEINPNIAKAHYNLGIIYYGAVNIQEALASFKKAVALDPNFSQAYNNLGLAYSEIGEKEQAIKYYKKAIEIDPDNSNAHNNLAVIYYYEKQYGLAIKHCDIAIKLGHKVSPEFLELLKPYRK